MRNYEYYAHAYLRACEDDPVECYKHFCELCTIFDALPKLADILLFDPKRFIEIESTIQEYYAGKVFNFIKLLVEDGIIDQLQALKKCIRSCLVEERLWNVCVIEISHKAQENLVSRIQALVLANQSAYVEFETRIDSSLKAGFRVFLNNDIFDISIDGRLKRLLAEVKSG